MKKILSILLVLTMIFVITGTPDIESGKDVSYEDRIIDVIDVFINQRIMKILKLGDLIAMKTY